MVRLCDRCHAPAVLSDAATASKTLVIPPTSPSTNPVTGPMEIALAIVVSAGADLCEICQISAVIEYLFARSGPQLTRDVLRALEARIAPVKANAAV